MLRKEGFLEIQISKNRKGRTTRIPTPSIKQTKEKRCREIQSGKEGGSEVSMAGSSTEVRKAERWPASAIHQDVDDERM